MELMLWNTVLSLVIGIVSWVLRDKAAELARVTILLNKTREEIARDHITRAEFRQDMGKLFDRFDLLEKKLDGLRERRAPGN